MRLPRLPRRLDHGEEATLIEHLEELRQRLFVCIGAVGVGFVVAFVFHDDLIRALERELPVGHRQLTTFTIGEPFMTAMWLSVYAGFLVALPIIIWQAWAFFLPAINPAHARVMRGFTAVSVALLVVGVLFGYYLALPAASHFLANYDKEEYRTFIRARDYVSFAAMVLVAMAIVFELPVFVVAMTRLGILQTRTLRKSRRLGYFIVCCVGVALPGVDPVTTAIETVPLLVLYEASIWASVLLERRAARRSAYPVST